MLYNNMTLDELINEIQYSEDPLLKAIYGKLTEDSFKDKKTKLKINIKEALRNVNEAENVIIEALNEL